MPNNKSTSKSRLFAASILVFGPVIAVHASIPALSPAEYSSHRITCELPVKLTHDCSAWQGATRPIAFADYRMTVAADSAGRTILLSRLRPGPSHNGTAFRFRSDSKSMQTQAKQAIQLIGTALGDRGIRLERMRPVQRAGRIEGYFLQFSANAYDYLKRFTVLESEYWLPKHRVSR
jgi:hypothetical protein